MPSKYVFVKTRHDYADEFDMESCFVALREDHEKRMKEIEDAFAANKYNNGSGSTYHNGIEVYFGTNEFFDFDNFKRLDEGVTVEECTEEFYNEFRKIAKQWPTQTNPVIGFDIIDAYHERRNGSDEDEDDA